jgi:hypothetical protein
MQRTLIAAFLLVALSVGHAKEEKQGVALTGAGASTCTEFANVYRGDPTFAENLWFTWTQGFMSGMNNKQIEESGNSVNLNSITTKEQKQLIRLYCDAHPLAPYLHAVMDLYYNHLSPNKPVTSTGAK